MVLGGDSPAASASVRIGGYSLEVGQSGGSFAHFEPEPEGANADELRAALADETRDQPPAVVAFEGGASEVTNRIEEADGLFRAAAGGQLLDPALITGEIGSLLDLVGRLDRSGRFGEQLEVMRSVNRLAVLGLRWLELVRALRSHLGSARAARHLPGQAWAHHELGSLHLCAGEPEKAEEHLREALRIEDELGDTIGRCATRHNLDSARRDLAGSVLGYRRLLRMAALAVVLLLLGGGATGVALAIHGHGNPRPTIPTNPPPPPQPPPPPPPPTATSRTASASTAAARRRQRRHHAASTSRRLRRRQPPSAPAAASSAK